MPGSQISYKNFDQLVEDGFTVYGRIQDADYSFRSGKGKIYRKVSKHRVLLAKRHFDVWGQIEIFSVDAPVSGKLEKIKNYSRIHPSLLKALIEPVDFLGDLVNVDVIDKNIGRKYNWNLFLTERISQIQHKIIASDLDNCSRTAWVLPNYVARNTLRNLRRSGKHSDVGSEAYVSTEIIFFILGPNVPSLVLQRILMISNTGLFDWWQRLINRSDLVMGNSNIPPKKPNMSGNIINIFVLLVGGLSIALLCMVLESWRLVFAQCKFSYQFIIRKLLKLFFHVKQGYQIIIRKQLKILLQVKQGFKYVLNKKGQNLNP